MANEQAQIVLDGVTLIGATSTVRAHVVPRGATVAISGRSPGAPPEVTVDGVRLPSTFPLRRDDVSAGVDLDGFATLIPRALLGEGPHHARISAGCASTHLDFVVSAIETSAASLGRLDEVFTGSETVQLFEGRPLAVPAATPLSFSGWAYPGRPVGGSPILLRVGDIDVFGRATIERADVHAAHPSVPSRCGYVINVPRDALPRGVHDVQVAALVDDVWLLIQAVQLRVESRLGLIPVDMRPVSAVTHRVGDATRRVLFLAGGRPAAAYRSAADPLLYRAGSRDDCAVALEVDDARAIASSA